MTACELKQDQNELAPWSLAGTSYVALTRARERTHIYSSYRR